jgi:translation elongation factor EF-G
VVADFNEEIMMKLLEGEEVSPEILSKALKQSVWDNPKDFVIGMAGR